MARRCKLGVLLALLATQLGFLGQPLGQTGWKWAVADRAGSERVHGLEMGGGQTGRGESSQRGGGLSSQRGGLASFGEGASFFFGLQKWHSTEMM